MNNPTEIRKPQPEEKDEPWIRDVQAATLACLFQTPEEVAAMCEGERFHCEICGEGFPLWPIQNWAKHFTEVHRDAITLQQHQGVLSLCTAGLTDATRQFLSVQLVTRCTIRRRARDLGMTRFVDQNGQIIEKEKPRIIQ